MSGIIVVPMGDIDVTIRYAPPPPLDMMDSNGFFYPPLDLEPEHVDINVIAHALSHLCRFGGHASRFYSVAEHAINVAKLCPPHQAFWGLMHDASEAYLIDLPTPIKRADGMDVYREAEKKAMRSICKAFGLPEQEPPEVKQADAIMLATEQRDLMNYVSGKPTANFFVTHGPGSEEVKRQFLWYFNVLSKVYN